MRTSLVSFIVLGLASAVLAAPQHGKSTPCSKGLTDPDSMPTTTSKHHGHGHKSKEFLNSHPKPTSFPTESPTAPPEKADADAEDPHKQGEFLGELPTSTPPPTSSPPPESPQTTEPQQTSKPTDTPKSQPKNDNLDEFTKTYVDLHNAMRANYSAPPLEYNATIAAYGQNYINGVNCQMVHSHGPYGENLCLGYTDMSKCIQAWYDEGEKFDFIGLKAKEPTEFDWNAGHFTQVVWKSATQIGCAQTACGHGYLQICNYDHGNMMGQFQENISPHI